jgi:hypothetical protein
VRSVFSWSRISWCLLTSDVVFASPCSF